MADHENKTEIEEEPYIQLQKEMSANSHLYKGASIEELEERASGEIRDANAESALRMRRKLQR